MIIWYSVLEIWRVMDVIVVFHFGQIFAFLPPTPPPPTLTTPKMKKTPSDIIILNNCTKNHDHMLYYFWEKARDTCNFYFSFWAIFYPFIPLKAQKIKISQKWKKTLQISSFYTCVPKTMIRWCTVPEIWCGWMEKVTYRGGCPTLK